MIERELARKLFSEKIILFTYCIIMDILLHLGILAVVFYVVLTKDLKVPHKKALTRCVLLAVLAGAVHLLLQQLRLEAFNNNTEEEK